MSWTVPPPPNGPPQHPPRPIRGRKVAAGIGLAVLGQVVAIGLGVGLLVALGSNSDNAVAGLYVEIALQVLLFLACLVCGIVWIVRRDRGIGLGLLIGWAVTVLVFPIAGIGICVALLNGYSGSGSG